MSADDLGRRDGQARSSRRSTTSSAGRPSSTARRSTGCARRTSASLRHHDGVSPAWPIGYDEMEPYYTKAEQLYQVHGARGEDPTEPPASAPYPFPAVSHEPRIQQLSDDLAAAGLPALPRTLRGHARRGEHGLQRLRPLSRLRRLPLPGARQVRRRGDRRAPGARARQRDPADGTRERWRWRPTARGPPSPRSWSSATASARRTPPTSSSSPAARPTRPSCCSPRPTTSIPTASPTAPTRSGATTCSTTARRCWRCRRKRTRPSSRRPWG